jgi:hypothetical protein
VIVLCYSLLEFEKKLSFEGTNSNNKDLNLARFALSLDVGRHLWLLEPHNNVSIPVTLNVIQ